MIRNLLREPLVHFLALGGLLFGLHTALFPGDPASRTVTVNRWALLNYLQYRVKRFDTTDAEIAFNRLTGAEREQLVREYVEQELLYREAKRFGLDEGDDVIRQRMIQKARFVLSTADLTEPTTTQLRDYYRKHIADFTEPARLTFTHVFFDVGLHGAAAQMMAKDAVETLRTQRKEFSDTREMGDRFPYLINYVDRPTEYVLEHFGEDFAEEVAKDHPTDTWYGPLKSQFGWHAVLVTARDAAGPIPFDDVRSEVTSAFKEHRSRRQSELVMERLKRDYDIRIDFN